MHYPKVLKKFIITGPESSGKSTLCKSICEHFDKVYRDEYAREYLDKLNRPYQLSDLKIIAEGQHTIERSVMNVSSRFSIHDTDLLTIQIWSSYKFKTCDPWIQQKASDIQNKFYLLCSPNIPWVADPLRENPTDRDELFDIYLAHIRSFNRPYKIIKDIHRSEREQTAIKWINDSR